MKIKLSVTFIIISLFISCAGQRNTVFIPEPDFSVYEFEKQIEIDKIIETKDGAGIRQMPNWLRAYMEGGIDAVERLDAYSNKYVFIGINTGSNFAVLTKWSENFSAARDFPMLAAVRIENRMISTASLYPDDEYGLFFEKMIKSAYGAEYPGAVKEATYWIKIWFEDENSWEYTENYMFFVLITVDRTVLQANIRGMMARTSAAVTVTPAQQNTINRLRQTFFQGF